MKFYFVAINAKYSHTALGIRSVIYYGEAHHGLTPHWGVFTINQRPEDILKTLVAEQADCYLFSTYIWNSAMTTQIAGNLAKILPKAKIFFGGPEASYKAEALLKNHSFLDGVLLGEGEETTAQLLLALEDGRPLHQVAGLRLPTGVTPAALPLNLDLLPFAYPDLDQLPGRILYYESMRGCPFSCSYCLSSVERGVRMKSIPLVLADLERFLEANPRQVKFVDRTFNCDSQRANQIWQFLIEQDRGVTNFHFELAGDLLTSENLALLATARPGLFQFEIGVQSTNPQTLRAINRTTNLEKLKRNVMALQKTGNIHLHLDLIAGLPYENLERFVESFHWVHQLEPNQFQLGFLKVLGGSQMEAQATEFGLKYNDHPPFQVLLTNWLSYEELVLLEGVAEMVEIYRNSGRHQFTTNRLLSHTDQPFWFYHRLWRHYIATKGEGPLSKLGYYDLLGSFAVQEGIPVDSQLKALCRYDLMLHEKPKKIPLWAEDPPSKGEKDWVRDFYRQTENLLRYLPDYGETTPQLLERITHLALFPFHPETGERRPTAVLVDYQKREIDGSAKRFFITVPQNPNDPSA